MSEAKIVGRPSKGEDAKRSPIALRTTKRLKDELEASAAASGRSLAQEVEARLQGSFGQNTLIPPPHTADFISKVIAAISRIERDTGKLWTQDLNAFTAVESAVSVLLQHRAPGWPAEIQDQMAVLENGYHVVMKNYRNALEAFQQDHPECPQFPNTEEIRAWLAADRQFTDAASSGMLIATRLSPPPLRQHRQRPENTAAPTSPVSKA